MGGIQVGSEVEWWDADLETPMAGTVTGVLRSGRIEVEAPDGSHWAVEKGKLSLYGAEAEQVSGNRAQDLVNHPPHYTKYPVEVIELTRHMSFGRGNAVKYIARAGLKSKETELEDLRKALFYIQDEITMLEDRA